MMDVGGLRPVDSVIPGQVGPGCIGKQTYLATGQVSSSALQAIPASVSAARSLASLGGVSVS